MQRNGRDKLETIQDGMEPVGRVIEVKEQRQMDRLEWKGFDWCNNIFPTFGLLQSQINLL